MNKKLETVWAGLTIVAVFVGIWTVAHIAVTSNGSRKAAAVAAEPPAPNKVNKYGQGMSYVYNTSTSNWVTRYPDRKIMHITTGPSFTVVLWEVEGVPDSGKVD